jgi:RND family efflux transporter MFP subunit
MIRYLLQFVLGVLVLGGAVWFTKRLIDARPVAKKQDTPVVLPVVRALTVQAKDVRIDVEAHGTVAPRTETTLVAEVTGKVAAAAPAWVAGGFFAAGDELVTVDAREYELAVTAAAADVAQRQTTLAIERAEAEVALAQWRELGKGDAPPLVARQPQVAQAEAALAASEARLQRAQLDLERCHVRAPYAGRVWETRADLGQYVTAGTALGRIYAVDYAEVRLPIADEELAFVDLPLAYAGQQGAGNGPPVTLHATFAGASHQWEARIVRTEGEIDPASRMVHAVARVDAPYARAANGDVNRPPLAVGMFARAVVQGRTFADVIELPRSAVRPGGDQVLVIGAGDKLEPRKIDVLRRTREEVFVRSGLHAGERVCLTPLEVFSPGMQVKVAPAEASR